ncbi:TolB family protein [Lutimonas sp.]|uniref:TolB family protein n=1 Tax=Lutimonas sp. TaxID=1872403 RepID=UPI003D9B7158
MIKTKIKITGLLIICLAYMGLAQNNDVVQPAFTALKEYPKVRDFTLSNSGKEAYFSIQSLDGTISVISKIIMENDTWSSPIKAIFSGQHHDIEPFLSPDNLRLYFASSRPKNNQDHKAEDYDIWYVQRSGLNQPWSEPVNMGTAVNSDQNEFYPSVAHNKNLYFTSDRSGSKGKDDIFYSRWDGKVYETPVSLGATINSEGYEFNAYISPSESFLIFSGYNRKDGLGSADLYISHKGSDKNWREAINFGSVINSDKMDYCPFVDVKNKTLYFTSQRSAVNAQKALENGDEFLIELNKYENGMSRIYKIGLETIFHINE